MVLQKYGGHHFVVSEIEKRLVDMWKPEQLISSRLLGRKKNDFHRTFSELESNCRPKKIIYIYTFVMAWKCSCKHWPMSEFLAFSSVEGVEAFETHTYSHTHSHKITYEMSFSFICVQNEC